MTAEANFEIVRALIRKRDGSYETLDLKDRETFPWGEPLPLLNAHPDRWKLCPACYQSKPIAEFLIETDALRTYYKIDSYGSETAIPVADVAERCKTCR